MNTTAPPPDVKQVSVEELQLRLDTRTKPQGSLGQLEILGIQIGLALNTATPIFTAPQICVFAADHGIAAAGVSAFPQTVTQQMVLNYLNGGAAINVLARQHGISLRVIDAGVAADLSAHSKLARRSIAQGTANFLHGPAMTLDQCNAAIEHGRAIAMNAFENGSNALLLGEMGIGNTASAAMLLHIHTGWPLRDCVGRGTGLDDAGLAHKLDVLIAASERVTRLLTPLESLLEFGGFELAMLVGAMLTAPHYRCILVLDGFAVSVAALLAIAMDERVRKHCIFSHCSAEHAHRKLLNLLQVTPLLDLNLRLGEGSGAALAWPLIEATARLMTQMASFTSAGVDDRNDR